LPPIRIVLVELIRKISHFYLTTKNYAYKILLYGRKGLSDSPIQPAHNSINPHRRTPMKSKDLKKFLASLGVAGLISAGGITVPGAHAAGSG
jgi:radical SAM modification target selenobiotic family peptide